jgi:hypothetical protein
MKKDGFGLDSTRGNNSVAESLRQADGHPAGAPATFDDGLMGTAPGMNPGMNPAAGQAAPVLHPCPPACD